MLVTMEGKPPGRRIAQVLPKRDGLWVVVRRTRPNGAMDFSTWHLTRRGARKAARRYEQTGMILGVKP